jgi:MFS family permease
VLFSFGTASSVAVIYAGILLHGFAYGCAYIAGQIMVNERSPAAMRAAAQGFWAVATMGVGNLLGTWSAGAAVQHFALANGSHDWSGVWLVSATVSGAALLGVLFSRRLPDTPVHAPAS